MVILRKTIEHLGTFKENNTYCPFRFDPQTFLGECKMSGANWWPIL